MDVFEIVGYNTGVSQQGVNFLQPSDSFQIIENGYIYRQELKSRNGFVPFAPRLAGQVRVMGIFENVLPDQTIDCLAIDKKFLYKYNAGTNVFDQIPFTSADPIDPILGFDITSNFDYVSGTSYFTKDGTQRFVFTGKGMSDIYFYDGTGVKRFTNATDNPDYSQPPQGAFTRATHVNWFGERINFFVPIVDGIPYSQGVLYSGIRDSSGNGDKFDVPGSGILSCDTFEALYGAIIAGDFIIMLLQRSFWTLEKTRDVFNPYFTRKIPSVLGTQSSFSTVFWKDEVEAVGQTGIATSDGRQVLRTDTKIPYFTQDEIDPLDFDLIYGGFDRRNAQFLFSYREGGSTLEDTQNKVLVHNYEERTWSVNDERFSVFGQTDVGQDLVLNDIDETRNPSWGMMNTTEEIWNRLGIGKSVQKTLAGDDLGFIYELNEGYDDYFISITGITQAAQAVVTVVDSPLQIGDKIFFDSVEGMTEINGLTGNVVSASVTSITVDIDSTDFTTYSTGGNVQKIISFYAKTIPFNPYRSQGRRVYVSHVEFLLNTNNGNLLVDTFADEEETPFKKDCLIQPSGIQKARQYITMVVDQESEFIEFALKQESPSAQVIVSYMRIHASPGGYTGL